MLFLNSTIITSFCLLYNILTMNLRPYYNTTSSSNITGHKQLPFKSILTVDTGEGRLGNRIWEYMSLYAVWQQHYNMLQHYRLSPVISSSMQKDLDEVFEKLTITPNDYFDVLSKKFRLWKIPIIDVLSFPQNSTVNWKIILASGSVRYKEILSCGIDNIKDELRFRKNLVRDVNDILVEIGNRIYPNLINITYIGMHYRGDDYIQHMHYIHRNDFKAPPNISYYLKSIHFFKMKFSKTIFILVTTDEDWLEINSNHLNQHGDIVINPFKYYDRAKDLALLAHCNHSIISYGTFGTTAALFANGITIVYDLKMVRPHDDGTTLAYNLALYPQSKWMLYDNNKD